MELSGSSAPVDDPRKETAALYKTSGLKVVRNAEGETHQLLYRLAEGE